MESNKTELLQGTLDLIILRILCSGSRHGYSIAKRIELISKDVLSVRQGSLYPALHRLEERGLVKSKWGVTETKRRARFYTLTSAGIKTGCRRNNLLEAVFRERSIRLCNMDSISC